LIYLMKMMKPVIVKIINKLAKGIRETKIPNAAGVISFGFGLREFA